VITSINAGFSQQYGINLKTLTTALVLLWPTLAWASIETAIALMEDQTNPLVELSTSKGSIYLELFAEEAPINVSQILALMAGEVELLDENTGAVFKPRYYNGMIFHKVIPGYLVQTGSSYLSPVGAPSRLLEDEINAAALGLASAKVLGPDAGTNPILNIVNEEGFKTDILLPLYRAMGIADAAELIEKQDDIIARLKTMSIQDLYELQGVSYIDNRFSHPNLKGTVALANTGPDTNGPEFFINLNDAPWLDGKHTVIGSVVEGLDVVEAIGSIEITAVGPSRLTSVIYSARRVH
jgi:peptidyl-prolyl cis-trans isomerase A (cyclophilin A)